jgi:hypothetical protein
VFKLSAAFWFLNFNYTFLSRLQSNPLAKVLETIGRHLANLLQGSVDICNHLTSLLQGVRENWQPSDKLLRGYWQLLEIAHICHMITDTLCFFA